MEEFIEVNSLGKKKLDNGLHVGFHRDAYDLVNACEVAKIGITEARKQEWKENLDLEGDINQESTADYITKEIDKKDEARDKLISFIFMMIRGYRLSTRLSLPKSWSSSSSLTASCSANRSAAKRITSTASSQT